MPYFFKYLNFQVISLNIYSAIFYYTHCIVAYKVYNTKWKISFYESFIYNLVVFNEAFESRPHTSFIEKSLYIFWEKCFVKAYSDVFSETKYRKGKNSCFFFSKNIICARGQAAKHRENFRLLVNIPLTFRLIKLPERKR